MIRPSRRQLLSGCAVLTAAGLTSCAAGPLRNDPTGPTLIDPAGPLPPIEDSIGALERRHNARIGVFAANLNVQRVLSHRAQESFAMCSTFKTYAAARVLQKAGRGELALSDAVTIEPQDIVPHAPVSQTRVGRTMTLSELCQAALQQSDNTAANWLLRMIGGPPAITAFARSIGDERTRLDRWETELNSAIPGDPRDTSTPAALGGGYRRLLDGDALAPQQRQQLHDWMQGNQTSSLRAGLQPGWTSADKTGGGDYGSTNDIGIVYGPDGQRVLLALMTRSQTDTADAPALRPLIGELTTLVLPALTGAG
jgi:beta-lactamase class A